MKAFIHDAIHLTQGELLLKYWWVWLLIVFIAVAVVYWRDKSNKSGTKRGN
jgi:hypothetical protein